VVGQTVQELDKLNILAGQGFMHLLLYNMPVKQLKQVSVVFTQVLHGAVQSIQVFDKASEYNPTPQSSLHSLV